MSEFNIDSFALELMRKVWEIGNGRGPDSQRKAQIQVAIAEAVGPLMTQQAGEPGGEPAAWLVHSRLHCTGMTKSKEEADFLLSEGIELTPLYTAPQAQPATTNKDSTDAKNSD